MGRVYKCAKSNFQRLNRNLRHSFFQPVLRYVKPTNQLQLTANELDEEFAQSLTAIRPGPGRVLVRFNLEEKAFKAEPQLEQMTVHYAADGSLFLRASEEGQRVIKAQAFAEAEEMRKVHQIISLILAYWLYRERGMIHQEWEPFLMRKRCTRLPTDLPRYGTAKSASLFSLYTKC